MRKGFILLSSLMVLLLALAGGCSNSSSKITEVTPVASNTVKLLNERVSIDIPQEWKLLKKNIGTIETEIYYIPFDNKSDPNYMGNSITKCHYCPPKLTVETYSNASLKSLQDKSKGHQLISDEYPTETRRKVKWIGVDGKKQFVIWDLFAVEQEVALNFRVTCPKLPGKQNAIDKIEREVLPTIESIIITEKPEVKPEEEKQPAE